MMSILGAENERTWNHSILAPQICLKQLLLEAIGLPSIIVIVCVCIISYVLLLHVLVVMSPEVTCSDFW